MRARRSKHLACGALLLVGALLLPPGRREAAAREAEPVRGCAANDDCAGSQYCAKAAGACADSGQCATRPEVCADLYKPVCGCDGRTYSSACRAAAAGINVQAEGACAAAPPA